METKRKYSILYPDIEDVKYKTISENTFHDLGLDTLCEKVAENKAEYRLIKAVISNMTPDPRVSRYRQKVFCDILKFPELRGEMIKLFDKFEFIRNYGDNCMNADEKKGNLAFASQNGRTK